MGKRQKEHNKKVAKRNENIKQQRKLYENAQRKFLTDLIEKEKKAGAFENNPTIDPLQGPQI